MKHISPIAAIASIAIAGSALTLSAIGYRKHLEANSPIPAEQVVRPGKAAISHQAPSLSESAFQNRTSEREAPTLRGLVVDANVPYICEFKAEKGFTVSNIFSDPYMPEASGGAFFAEGKFYVLSGEQQWGGLGVSMTVYDADTWDIVAEHYDLLPSSCGYTITYDPITNAAYGYFMNDDLDPTWCLFGRMNLATGEVVGLNNVDSDDLFVALAAATDGYLYGITKSGMFCRLTKKGVITPLGHTDVKPAYVQSACVDPATGKFYWAGFTDEGKSGLYVVDPTTYMADLIQAFPANQEIVGLYVVENKTADKMPAEVTDLEVSFVRDTYDGTVTFTAPDHYGNGSAIEGKLTAHVAVDGTHQEKSVSPGEKVSFDVKVSYEGLYNIAAWASTADAAGNKSYVQKWAGPDQPGPVTDLKASVDGYKVTLTWEAPEMGIHGGYLNPDDIAYIIGREGYGDLYIRDHKQTTYVDTFDESVSADVRYYVRSSYQFYGGQSRYTNYVHVGKQVLEVPFSLSPSSDYDKFIVVDANEDEDTWEKYFGGYVTIYGSEDDDWMITPEINLEAGTVYQLSYDVSAKMGPMYPELIEVMIGTGDTPANLTTQIDSQKISTIGINKFTSFTPTFSVEKSGTYRLGFHAISTRGQQIGLGGIEVTKLASSSGPQAVTALSISPADKGVLRADVSFTLPTEDSDGKTLTALSKVELYNGKILVDSKSDITPGAECTLTDPSAENGNNNYTVVAYGADGTKGLSATVSGWVGLDIPELPSDLQISELEDGLNLKWTAPASVGIHGGYVDTDHITYDIVYPTFGIQLGTVSGVCEANIHFERELTSQSPECLGVRVKNEAGMNSNIVVSPTIIAGPAYGLPFHEHFYGGGDYMWNLQGNTEEGFGWNPEKETVGQDGLLGVSSYYGETEWDAQSLLSGKIAIPAGSKASLRMWLMCKSFGGSGKFSIGLSETYGKDYKVIYSKEFNSDSDKNWQPLEVSLAEYAGKTVYLALQGLPEGDGGMLIGIDDLIIREFADYDAAVTNVTLDTDEVEVGRREATVNVWLANYGRKDLKEGDYMVDFYAGDRKFASLPGKEMNGMFGYSTYTTAYAPTTDDSDPTPIILRISCDDDEDLTNNTSDPKDIYVVVPELPSAGLLSAEAADGGVDLKWEAADQSPKPVRTVTDDFESYRTWDNNRAGSWTMVDADSIAGIRPSYFFPGSTGSLGWVVMQPSQIPSLAEEQPAYSGSKYLVSFCPVGGDSNDWLITPELSGRAQRVSFMARGESFYQGREMFEVWYSTKSTDLADMIRLDDTDYRTNPAGWTEFAFDLPEGAKYFAVRCVSHSRVAMHIDDFTYESAETPVDGKLVGYNIYCNGERLNDQPTTALTFRHAAPALGENTYYVRAVYDRGEAPAGNRVTLSLSGVETILYDINPSATPVYDLNGLRVYEMEEGEVYVSSGRRFIFGR